MGRSIVRVTGRTVAGITAGKVLLTANDWAQEVAGETIILAAGSESDHQLAMFRDNYLRRVVAGRAARIQVTPHMSNEESAQKERKREDVRHGVFP